MINWAKNRNGILIPKREAGFIQPGMSMFRGKPSGGGGQVYSDVVMQSAPIHYWPLSETSGSFTDEAGTSNATPTGSIGYGGDKIANNLLPSAIFSGGYLSATLASLAGSISVEFWMVPNITSGSQTVFSWNGNYGFRIQIGINRVSVIYHGASYNSMTAIAGVSSHVVCSASASGWNTYVNSILVNAGTNRWTTVSGTFNIGCYDEYKTEVFSGYLSDVAIYNKILTGEEIATHYSVGMS